MQDFLSEQTVLGWSLLEWVQLVGAVAAGTLALVAARSVAVRRIGRLADWTKNRVDDILVEVLRSLRVFFLAAIAATVASKALSLDVPFMPRILLLAAFLQVGLSGNRLIHAAGTWYAEANPEESARVTAARAIQLLGRLVLWSLLVVLTLDNFGIDITALITGLGIGGVAVALAVQNVLKDILAYVSIMVDQPFVIGDFLLVGEHTGTVEAVGIKSTRLRSLSGEQLIFSNEDLLQSRIRNFKRMSERRILFAIGVEYGTPAEKLEAIPTMIKSAIEAQENTRFDRAHLKAFDDFAVTFEAVYYTLVPDYAAYMDTQQAINLRLYADFEREGISFAFPTQTLHVASMPQATAPAAPVG